MSAERTAKLVFYIEFVFWEKLAWKCEARSLEFVGIPSCFSTASASGGATRRHLARVAKGVIVSRWTR